ncbi:MAG: alpha/beta hydrolase, partial [bacterium]
MTTCIASLTRMINIRAKFKEDEAGTRRRIEHMQEKKYEVPKYFKPSFSLKERVIKGMRVFFLNEETKSDRVLFYIHGGGWVEEISWLHWKFLNRIAKLTDAKIIIPLYPLAPFYTYKDTFPSIVELYRTMIQENPNKKMIIGGDSAGGN